MAETILPPDPTLDEMRAALGAEIPVHAMFDGWRDSALENAARALGLDPAHARLAFPDGALGMIEAWYASIDSRLAERFSPEQLGALKIRERIAALVLARLEIMRPCKQAARTALGILALPQNMATAARLGWRAADGMWRLAGDTATDFNHYSKRLTLAGVYAATLLVWLDDESEDEAETRAFLARRIDGVMRFEKWKANLLPATERRFSMTRFLGRLRYPVA